MRNVDDMAYMECLPSEIYRRQYLRWKSKMLPQVEEVVTSIRDKGLKGAMSEQELTPRDIMLLVKLHYLTEDEIKEFELSHILNMEMI